MSSDGLPGSVRYVKNGRSGRWWKSAQRNGQIHAGWSNASVTGRLLAPSELPGTVTTTAGFRATVCTPKDSEAILRLIKGETDKDAIDSADRRRKYELAVHKIVQRLSPQDFEHLIDLILAGTGWERVAVLGGTREGVDVEAESPAADEIAFVQVKRSAGQDVLDDYIERFMQLLERYERMVSAVHTPRGRLVGPRELPVQVWTGERVAELAARLGLGKWVESRLS
jgi:Restriction endonuclease